MQNQNKYKIDKLILDAQTAEENERYCLAAILWRRAGEVEEANICEEIAQSIAIGLMKGNK